MLISKQLGYSLLVTILFICDACAAEYIPIATYLTWQRSPDTTMTVSWITPLDKPQNVIEYQQEGSNQWLLATGRHKPMPQNEPYLIHTVELTNLSPNTTYTFRSGPEARPYKFQTMPTTLTSELHFVAGGDMYHDSLEAVHATNRQAAKTNPLFALIGGDIAYTASRTANLAPKWLQPWLNLPTKQKSKRWLAWLTAWTNDVVTPDGRLVPILPVLGNHDVSGHFGQTPVQSPFFYSLFALPGPQGYQVLDFGDYMSIFLLDSGHTHPIEGMQTTWLEKTLAARAQVPYKFALYHVPAYPSARPYLYPYSQKIRFWWVPLFEKYHLTAAFENHDHDYKRTHLLKKGVIDPSGVLYLGDGAWGVEKPRQAKNATKKPYLARTAAMRHFLHMTISPAESRVEAVSSTGEIFDTFAW